VNPGGRHPRGAGARCSGVAGDPAPSASGHQGSRLGPEKNIRAACVARMGHTPENISAAEIATRDVETAGFPGPRDPWRGKLYRTRLPRPMPAADAHHNFHRGELKNFYPDGTGLRRPQHLRGRPVRVLRGWHFQKPRRPGFFGSAACWALYGSFPHMNFRVGLG